MRRFGYLWIVVIFLGSGCQGIWPRSQAQRLSDQNEYAREIYRQQHEKRAFDDGEQRWDQVDESDLLVDIEGDPEAKWSRLPYETVDEWLERIYATLRHQNDELQELEKRLETLQEHERRQIGEIQQLLQVQQELRETVAEVESRRRAELESQFQIVSENPMPQFFVHMVRPGDTLFSIAMHYYGDKSMVREILHWNQRWVRNEYELIAGLGLILFPVEVQEANPQIVEKFIEEMDIPN